MLVRVQSPVPHMKINKITKHISAINEYNKLVQQLKSEIKNQNNLLCTFVSQNCKLININQKLTDQLLNVGVAPDNKE